MKLWQKIFLCTLILVMLAVSVTSILLLKNSFTLAMEQERQAAVSEHEFLITSCKSMLFTQRLRQNAILLEPSAVNEIIESTFDESRIETFIWFYDEDKELIYANQKEEKHHTLLDMIEETDTSFMQLTGDQLYTASREKMEGNTYYIVTSVNISEAIIMHENMLLNIRTISMMCSIAISVVLLFVVKWLLQPLQRINKGTKEIAEGNYDRRIEEKGSSELAELAHNMNIMAEAVEKNVGAIEAVSEERKQFIANLSHEMKTPLTSILGFADLLCIRKDISTDQRLEYAHIIKEEASRMRTLSGKLLELITVGSINSLWEEVDMEQFFEEIEASLLVVANSRQMKIVCESGSGNLNIDKELFKSLIYNLADNGMKASDEGSTIEIKGEFHGKEYIFTVTDQGVGIPEEEIDKIRQAFYMVDKVRSRAHGGAGLGLALCQEIVALHRGKMKIESEQKQGTIITVKLRGGI